MAAIAQRPNDGNLAIMITNWPDVRFEPVALTSLAGQALADVSIEVAHVSASLAGGDGTLDEIASCLRRYKHIVESLEYGGGPGPETNVCLIDDYNHPRPANLGDQITQHVNHVESFGVQIDYIVFESDLELLRDEFLSINRDQRLARYIQTRHRSPCSAHIAMWYLARLGKLTTTLPAFRRASGVLKPFFAHQLLSILPRYYDTFEERAAIVLGHSALSQVLSYINHAYFDAEPPANLEYNVDMS